MWHPFLAFDVGLMRPCALRVVPHDRRLRNVNVARQIFAEGLCDGMFGTTCVLGGDESYGVSCPQSSIDMSFKRNQTEDLAEGVAP